MDPALIARSQMALSLAFHIVFASVGIAMPVMMVLAELRWLRTGDRVSLDLAHRWAKGTAVMFAIGAVSGTVLSFELGLLFPGFMRLAGPLIGLPFSLEGFAFFIEAIFLGIYLYGWKRITPRLHVFSGVVVALSGLASAVFVTFVNAWMNAPRGFTVKLGVLNNIDPLGAFQSPFAFHEIVHGSLAAYAATGLAVAGIHARALLLGRAPEFHRRALSIALWVALPACLLQPVIGHLAGQRIAEHQPAKLAALEQLQHTQTRAPLTVGPFEIPGALSFMAFNDVDARVIGLQDFAAADRPPALVRPAFLLMVSIGTLLAGFAGLIAWQSLRGKRPWQNRRVLWAILVMAPLGFVALEAGWIVTEVGRQPWVVYGVIRTASAVTPAVGLGIRLAIFSTIYVVLAVTVFAVLRRHVRATFHATLKDLVP